MIVSSGAIVSGIKKLGLKEYPKSLPVKQAAAAVGQSRLMWAYEKSFERLDVKVAQILLTHLTTSPIGDDFSTPATPSMP